jgi:hypothetical protein
VKFWEESMDNKNIDSPKAYYPGKNYDQSGWMWEKTDNIIRYLCRLIDANQPEDKDLKDYIEYAIRDAFKLYTFWIGNNELFTQSNLELILKNGSEGFKNIKYTNGLSYQIDKFTQKEIALAKRKDDEQKEKEIFELIVPESNNRTFIYDKLHELSYKSDQIKKLEKDIEKVTMGEKTWQWLVNIYKNSTKS